jgi:hypothetical protein
MNLGDNLSIWHNFMANLFHPNKQRPSTTIQIANNLLHNLIFHFIDLMNTPEEGDRLTEGRKGKILIIINKGYAAATILLHSLPFL